MKSMYCPSFFFALLLSCQCFLGVQSFFVANQAKEVRFVVNKKNVIESTAITRTATISNYNDVSRGEKSHNALNDSSRRKGLLSSNRNLKIFEMRSLRDSDSSGENNGKEGEAREVSSNTSSSFYFHDGNNQEQDNTKESSSNEIEDEEESRHEFIDIVDEAEASALNNLVGQNDETAVDDETDETTSSTKFLRFNKGFGAAPKDPPKMKKTKGRKPTTHRMDMRNTPNGGKMGVMPKTSDKPGERVFDLFVEYPCKFQMKVIGLRDENFEKDMVEIVAKVVKKPAESIEHRNRDKGKYRSVTIEAPVENSDQVYECYAKLSEDPRVIYKI